MQRRKRFVILQNKPRTGYLMPVTHVCKQNKMLMNLQTTRVLLLMGLIQRTVFQTFDLLRGLSTHRANGCIEKEILCISLEAKGEELRKEKETFVLETELAVANAKPHVLEVN